MAVTAFRMANSAANDRFLAALVLNERDRSFFNKYVSGGGNFARHINVVRDFYLTSGTVEELADFDRWSRYINGRRHVGHRVCDEKIERLKETLAADLAKNRETLAEALAIERSSASRRIEYTIQDDSDERSVYSD